MKHVGHVSIFLTLGPLSIVGCGSREDETQLRVFLADSLSLPFASVAEAFERDNPGVEVISVPSGSVLAARKLSEANDEADVLAVADYQVIERLLRPEYADWYACFATNEIAIAYTDASRGAAELKTDNWWRILSGADVDVAAADPAHDPCGYWTELCWRLADLHYPPDQGGGRISEMMTAKCGEPDRRRADAQQLLQLIETPGGLDYAFVYRSQAMQHNLSYLRLPPEINLGSPSHIDFYRRAVIELPGKRRGRTFEKRGDAIVFAITVPRTARHADLAERFVAFVLSDEGRSLLEAEHITVIDEPWTYDPDRVPTRLHQLVAARARPEGPETLPSGSDDE